MAKRPAALYLLAALSAAAGWLLPRAFQGLTLSFALACLLAAAQEALMFGLPALLMLRALEPGEQPLRRLGQPGAYLSGLAMLCAVSYVLVGALLGALFYSLLSALGLTPDLPPAITPGSLGELALAALTIGGVTAFCEELFFRAALPRLLGRRLGHRVVITLCALLFAILHFNLAGLPTLLLFALLMHRIVQRHGGLMLAILFHWMYNFSILVMNYAQTTPDLRMILLSSGLFVLTARLLLRGDRQEATPGGP